MKHSCALLIALTIGTNAHSQPADPLSGLMKQLSSKDAEKRTDALIAIAELGPKAAPAIPALTALLAGVNEEDRVLATLALGKIGKAALPAVEKLHDHEDETTRYYAVWVVGLLGDDAKALAPRLLKMFETDADEEVRTKAGYALARCAPESKDVQEVFAKSAAKAGDTSAVRRAVLEELRHLGAFALPLLAKAMKEPAFTGPAGNPAYESFRHLLDHNKNDAFAKKALPHLSTFLATPDGGLFGTDPSEEGLAWILVKHGETLLPGLDKDLKDKDARMQAVQVLGHIAGLLQRRSEAPELVKRICTMLKPHFRAPESHFLMALAPVAPLTDETRPEFELLLLHQHTSVRLQAAMRLHEHQVDVTKSLKARMNAAKAEDKLPFAVALMPFSFQNADAEAQKVVLASLDHTKEAIRVRAAAAIGMHRNEVRVWPEVHKKAIAILVAALKSDRADLRLEAAEALVAFADLLHEHGDAIADRLDDPQLRRPLLLVLHSVHKLNAKKVLPKLLPFLEDSDYFMKCEAITMLGIFGRAGVPHLARLVEDEKPTKAPPFGESWHVACFALQSIGPEAREAIPALLRAAEKKERWLISRETLVAIDAKASFPGMLEILKKRDEVIRKTLQYPKATLDDPVKLRDALVKDWAASEGDAHQAFVVTLQEVMPILPLAARTLASVSITKEMSAHLTKAQKDLSAKDADKRLRALEKVGGLRMLLFSTNSLHGPQEPINQKDWLELVTKRQEHHEQIEKLLTHARADADLRIRREARRIQTFDQAPPGHFHPGVLFPVP